MRWIGGRQSDNIEDRRGFGVPLVAGGGIGTIVLLVLALFFGFDPSVILQGDGTPPPVTQAPSPSASPRGGDQLRDFVATVLADTEDTWGALFRDMGRQYREPKLVLFNTAVQSACGIAGSATGPFYCPQDQKVYLDLDFFRALRERFRAPGDFAQAYVIAHEVGHHVQKLLGISDVVMAERQRGGARGTSSRPATSRRRSAPQRRSVTIGWRERPAAAWRPRRSRTAPRSSACAGSPAASRRVTCDNAIPSQDESESRRERGSPEQRGSREAPRRADR